MQVIHICGENIKLKRRSLEPLYSRDPRCKQMCTAIYCRKSTATEGKSKSRDEQLVIARIDAKRLGFGKVLEFIEEEGNKGEWYWRDKNGHNPAPYRDELTRLVNGIEQGHIQSVIVYKQDRIVRDSGVSDALAKLFRKHKIHFIVGGRDAEIDTARGLSDNAMGAAKAREWRDNCSEEIGRDHDYKFDQGLFTRDPSCFGWRSNGRGTQALTAIYEELEIVLKIFIWFTGWDGSEELGPYQIAERLMDEGVVLAVGSKGHTPKNKHHIDSTRITTILNNPMYIGEWQHRGERKPYPQLLVFPKNGDSTAQPLIPIEMWEKAQAKLDSRPNCGNKSTSRLLEHLVLCGVCGRPCHVNTKNLVNGGQTLRWICSHRVGRNKSCLGEGYATIVVEEVDSWVEQHLAPWVSSQLKQMLTDHLQSPIQLELKQVEEEILECRRKATEELKKKMGVLDLTQFEDLAKSLSEQRLLLERRKSELGRLISTELEVLQGGEPSDLLSQDQGAKKKALHRYIKWIATSDKGVVAYTTLNQFVGGRFHERDMTAFGTADNRRHILPPDSETSAECKSWISDPSAFVRGRRYALGLSDVGTTDEQLIPFLGERCA
jgi:site-specific DNA recombinase